MNDLSRTLPPLRLMIGDRFLSSGSGGVFTHINPATGRPQAEIPLAGPAEVNEAVAAAKQASEVWRRTPTAQRRDALLRFAQLLGEHATEFGRLATLENGTPQKIAYRGAMQAEARMRYYAGWADKLEGQVLSMTPGERLDYTMPEPYGVIGIIITWNGPLISLGMKVAPALPAGNAVVIKPAEFTPYCAALFGELALKAGIPPGVVNIVPGSVAAGEALVAHPDVQKISFTGGPIAARRIMAAAAEQLKPLVFELGGKSANLVFADAPLERVAKEAVFWGVSLLSGQGCALPTRLLVERSVYPQVLDMVIANVKALKVGDPMDPANDMGPVVNAAACERILGIIEKAKAAHAGRLVAGGRRLGGALAEGYFMQALLSELGQRNVDLGKAPRAGTKSRTEFDTRQIMANWAGVDLTRINGLGLAAVMKILSEIGPDLSRFATVKHFCSWLGLCPGTKISGGKVLSAKTKRSANRVRQALKMAAMSLKHSDSALGAFYRRLCSRMDKPSANTAVAHKLARMVYFMLTRGEDFVDQGQQLYEKQQHQRSIAALKRRAAALGFELNPTAVPA